MFRGANMSRIVNNEKNIQMCIDVHGNLKKDVSKTSYVIYVELITPELSIKPNSIFSLSVYDARLLAIFLKKLSVKPFIVKIKQKNMLIPMRYLKFLLMLLIMMICIR